MRKMLAVVATGFVVLATAAIAEEETTSSREKSYLVTYPNKAKETYVVKYRASVSYNKWESGHPAEPAKFDFTDTRQCHWDISTVIIRDVCLNSASGQQYCQGNLSRVYGTSFSGKGSDFKVLGLRPENCGDANARYQSDLNDARNAVNSALNSVIENDAKVVSSDLLSTTKASSIKGI